jgi:hypothetical protein
MNLNNLPKRQRWLIGIAGGLVVLYLLNSVIFTPLTDAWEGNSAEITRLQNEVADGHSLIFRGPRLQQIWSQMRSASLPHDQAQSEHDAIQDFENWSRTSGVELGSVKPLWRHGDSDEFSLLECRLDATGSLGSLARFIYEMEKAPLALRVESIELTSRDDTGDRLTLSLVVTGLRLAPLEGKS